MLPVDGVLVIYYLSMMGGLGPAEGTGREGGREARVMFLPL